MLICSWSYNHMNLYLFHCVVRNLLHTQSNYRVWLQHTCSLSSGNVLVWRQKNLLKQYYTICIFIGHNFPTPNQWFVHLQIKWCKKNATCFLCLILEAWNLARMRGVWVAYQWGYCLQCEGIDARHGQWQDGYQENSLHQDTILQLP